MGRVLSGPGETLRGQVEALGPETSQGPACRAPPAPGCVNHRVWVCLFLQCFLFSGCKALCCEVGAGVLAAFRGVFAGSLLRAPGRHPVRPGLWERLLGSPLGEARPSGSRGPGREERPSCWWRLLGRPLLPRAEGDGGAHGLSWHPRCVCVRICVSACVRVFAWSPRLSLQSGQVSGWSHPAALPTVPPSFLHPFPRVWRLSSRLVTRVSRSCPRLGCRGLGTSGGVGVWSDGELGLPCRQEGLSGQASLLPVWKASTVQEGGLHLHPGRPSAAPRGEGPARRSAPPRCGSGPGGDGGTAPCFPSRLARQNMRVRDQSRTLGCGRLLRPAGPSAGDLAGLECAVLGTGVSFMLCPGAAEKRVFKCHIQWGLRLGVAGGPGFVRACFYI